MQGVERVSDADLKKSASVTAAVGEAMTLIAPLCLAVIVTILAKPPVALQWIFGVVVALLMPVWIGIRITELVVARKEIKRRANPIHSTA